MFITIGGFMELFSVRLREERLKLGIKQKIWPACWALHREPISITKRESVFPIFHGL